MKNKNFIKLDISLNSIKQLYIEQINENIANNKQRRDKSLVSKLNSEMRILTRDFKKEYYPQTIEEIEEWKLFKADLKNQIEEVKKKRLEMDNRFEQEGQKNKDDLKMYHEMANQKEMDRMKADNM